MVAREFDIVPWKCCCEDGVVGDYSESLMQMGLG